MLEDVEAGSRASTPGGDAVSGTRRVGPLTLVAPHVADAPPDADDEWASILRERMTRFALMASGLLLVFWTLALGFYFAGVNEDRGAFFDVVWIVALPIGPLVSRRLRASAKIMQLVDASTMAILGTFWAANGLRSTLDMPMEVPTIFMVTILLFARAVVVPSSFARSAVVGLLAAAPTMLLVATRGAVFLRGAALGSATMFVVFSNVWLLITVAGTAYASQLIFGLQQKVRSAARLGQYVLERKLGEGSTGTVFLARHVLLKRPAAVKVLRGELSSRVAKKSFEREVTITSALTHPNTVTVLDFGWTLDGVFYYVMDYLPGVDLDRLVREAGPLPDWRVVHFLRQACGSLAEAHGKGLLHRDIKPANLLVSERGGVHDVLHVVDFGLAASELESAGGVIAGSPGYIAPEVIAGDVPVDARSDLYSLGAVGYWLATGTHLFAGVSAADVCMKHVASDVEPPSFRAGRLLDPELEALLLECLAKKASERPRSARVMLERLEAIAARLPFDQGAAARFWERRAPLEGTAP